jgi:hypothetical protein
MNTINWTKLATGHYTGSAGRFQFNIDRHGDGWVLQTLDGSKPSYAQRQPLRTSTMAACKRWAEATVSTAR